MRCRRARRATITLVACAAAAVATVLPGAGVPAPGVHPQLAAQVTGLSPADLDLLLRVRQTGLWEASAGSAAQLNAGSDLVRRIGARIAVEDHDLDQAVRTVAARVGVQLPDQPTTDQQSWLRELASAHGEQFDRLFVGRLRTAHATIFPLIANVRAGSRNELTRAFASTVNTYVLRHMSYLEDTDLDDYAMPPTPAPSAGRSADSSSVTTGGALLPADRDLIIRLRQADRWMLAATATVQQQSTDSAVRHAASMIAAALSNQDGLVRSVATQLAIRLPDDPTPDQSHWLTRINTAQGTSLDRVFVSQLRAAAGTDLIAIANVRADTRNSLVRAVATAANDTAIQDMTYLENTGLVDYNTLPQEAAPPGTRVSSLDNGGGPPGYLIWLILATAATAATAATTALRRLTRSR